MNSFFGMLTIGFSILATIILLDVVFYFLAQSKLGSLPRGRYLWIGGGLLAYLKARRDPKKYADCSCVGFGDGDYLYSDDNCPRCEGTGRVEVKS